MLDTRGSRAGSKRSVRAPGQLAERSLTLERTLATGAVTLGVAALAPIANAATFTVTNTNDNGAGSLRAAVLAANANAGPDVIQFDPTAFSTNQTILLTTGEMKIDESVDIVGPTNSRVTIDAGGNSRIFYMYYPAAIHVPPRPHVVQDILLSNLSITNGNYVNDHWGGGAVSDWGDNVTLDHVTISNSHVTTGAPPSASSLAGKTTHASHHHDAMTSALHPKASATVPFSDFPTGGKGGGIAKFQDGFLHIKDSTISGNTAVLGGGVYVNPGADSYIRNSVVLGNNADYGGGGIAIAGVAQAGLAYDFAIQDTLITYNQTLGEGGGLIAFYTDGGSISVDHSTFDHNEAAFGGGAIFGYMRDPVRFTDTSFFFNQGSDYIGAMGFLYAASGSGVDFSTFAGNVQGSVIRTAASAAPTAAHGNGHFHAAKVGSASAMHRGSTGGAWQRRFAARRNAAAAGHVSVNTPETIPSAAGIYVGTSGGGVEGAGAHASAVAGFDVHNSLLAYEYGGADLGGGATFIISYSFVENTDSTNDVTDHSFVDGAGNRGLDNPANNGGPAIGDTPGGAPNGDYLPTALPMPGASAIDNGDDSDSETTDERGYTRPVGTHVDMGAVEVGAGPVGVPALGALGKLLLALTTMITGWFAIDRKRFLG